MTSDVIIDFCLKGIGEDDPDLPIEMTRIEVLELINLFYQNHIGKRLYNLTSYTYDASDAAHTITAGIGTLPTDFLSMSSIYDGDIPTNKPLKQIFDIRDKIADTSKTSQYMIPNNTQFWIFGITPTNTIKTYYYAKPIALTDSSSSSPTALKEEFHLEPFVKVIQKIYSTNNNYFADEIDLEMYFQDLLNNIEFTHKIEKRDDTREQIVDVYGGLGGW